MAYHIPPRCLLARPPCTRPAGPSSGTSPATHHRQPPPPGRPATPLPRPSCENLWTAHVPPTGRNHTVVVSSLEVAREFLQRHDAVLATRPVPDALRDHARNSVPWLPHSPRWRALRRIMANELFAPHRLDALRHLRREKVRELEDHVGRLAREGAAVGIGRVAFTTSLNLTSRTIFSSDVTDLDDRGMSKEFREVIAEIMEVAGSPNFSDFFPVLRAVDLQGCRRRMVPLLARMHWVFDVEVDQKLHGREAGEPRKNDFLDHLLDAGLCNNGVAVLDRDTLRSMFTDLFIAGSDTSSNTVEWAMVELLRNPFSMDKACEELSIGSGRNIGESEIVQLPYLQAVIRETFRLHPAPLLLPRQAEVTINMKDCTIPKGACVLINVWAIGRDKVIWPEPDKFMPERFLEKAVDFKGGDF